MCYWRGAEASRGVVRALAGALNTSASLATRRLPNTSSRVIGEPSGPLSGTRQFGYSSIVPGWFCAFRSPTASVSATQSSRDGVR